MEPTHDDEYLRSFGRCAAGTSDVYRPTKAEDVTDVFDIARKSGRHVVIRGGGHSFDGQAVHDQDTGKQLVLLTDCYQPDRIEFDLDGPNTVRLGCGVQWGNYFGAAVCRAQKYHEPIRIPGTMQTGQTATVGGTLAGDCLSRFSGTAGKESLWIDSFRIIMPNGQSLDVSEKTFPDLFHAVIGGHGYIGFVTDATYRLIAIDPASCAYSSITLHESFHDLIAKQIELVQQGPPGQAISSAWYTDPGLDILPFHKIKGGVFNSSFAMPHQPRLPGFPLYDSIESSMRYWTEVMSRIDPINWLIHEALYLMVKESKGEFENDLKDFLFFMDGNTLAKERYEALTGEQFPIVQQTFVIPTASAEGFAKHCLSKMNSLKYLLRPTESDMLFVSADECFMSANYHLDGFAITFAFEPIAPKGCPPDRIPALFRELSSDCRDLGGRVHLVKNVCADKDVLRSMFSPQIQQFEKIKQDCDPDLLLQNPFSDKLFDFRQ